MTRRDAAVILYGVLLWFVATVIFYYAGEWLVSPQSPVRTFIVFLLTVPELYICMQILFRWMAASSEERLRFAVFTAVPGMLLDFGSFLFHRSVFPTLSGESLPMLAAWLLWAYSLMLISGWVRPYARFR